MESKLENETNSSRTGPHYRNNKLQQCGKLKVAALGVRASHLSLRQNSKLYQYEQPKIATLDVRTPVKLLLVTLLCVHSPPVKIP